MTKHIKYSAYSLVAIVAGFTAISADGINNAQWAYETAGTVYDSTMLVIIAAAISSVGASMMMGRSIGRREYFRTVCCLGAWLVCAAFSLAISTERLAKQRADRAYAAKISAAADNAQQRKIQSAMKQVDKYCSMGRKYRTKCAYWRNEVQSVVASLAASKKQYGGDVLAPIVVELSAIAGITIKERHVNIVVPALAPIGLMLAGLFLTAFGAAGETYTPEFMPQAMGRSADVDKVARFTKEYQRQHNGRRPSINEISGNLNMSYGKARDIRKELATA